MSASFRDIASIVASDGAGVLRTLGRRAPTVGRTSRDLAIVQGVAAARTAVGTEYARGISDLGGTDLWTELARGLDLRSGGGTRAQDLITEARDLALPRWKGVQQLVARPRPYELDTDLATILRRPNSKSFPSGHTTGAYVGATILATIDPANADHYWAAAVDTARSRIYGGVHFPSDVEVGARLGHTSASEVLARHGLLASAMSSPGVSRVTPFHNFGVRDALAALAELRLPDGSGRAGDAALDELSRIQLT